MKPETLKGHLELLLLATISSGATHGYGIIKALRERSDTLLDLPDGTMYPALHRLESAGLLQPLAFPAADRLVRVYHDAPGAPQIFIGNYHVGGYRKLVDLDASGKLDALLQEAGVRYEVPHEQGVDDH